MESPGERLKQAISEAGFSSIAEAARIHRFHPQNVRDHAAGRRGISEAQAKAYGKALKVNWLWLLHGVVSENSPSPNSRHVLHPTVIRPVIGAVQGGVWQEPMELDESRVPALPVPAHIIHEGAQQFWLEVIGDSVNQYAPNGAHVFCTGTWDWARDTDDLYARANGKLVIVNRWRGDLFERTCKLLVVENGKARLLPASTSRRWSSETPIGLNENGDTTRVEIFAVVEWIGSPAP